MNTKSNVILVGGILLLVGALALLQNNISVSYWRFAPLAAGAVLLLLYRNKGKNWSLVLGLYLIYIGFVAVSGGLLPDYVRNPLITAMFFIVPGLIFLVRYIKTHRKGMLYPASFLIWSGVYSVASAVPFMHGLFPSLFLFCLGGAFLLIYFISECYVSKTHLYIGIALAALGLLRSVPLPRLTGTWPLVIIVAGLALFIYAIRKK